MKSFVVACCIFAFVIGALIGNAAFVLRCTDALTDAAAQLPDNTHGDPAQYEIAMQSIRYIWKENREIIAITVPHRITEPMERALRALEAGWITESDTVYRQAVADLLNALRNLQQAERFSLSGIV